MILEESYRKFRSYLRAYLNYLRDKKNNRGSSVSFYNFWPRQQNKAQDTWFSDFVHYYKLDTGGKKINFVSLFGKKESVYFIKHPRIFFTGENIHSTLVNDRYTLINQAYLSKFDLSLGFDYETIEDKVNYMRLPLWILYLIPFDATFEDIRDLIKNLNHPQHRSAVYHTRFGCNISKHDNNGIRRKMITLLSKIDEIKCAGNFMNNTSELRNEFKDNKLHYLRNFKFNICPENSNFPGYVTEKIFESIQAGCIPIYWGSENKPEPEILNPDAILFYCDTREEELFEKIKMLHENISAYEDFIRIPPFREKAAERIWEKLSTLKSKLEKL